VNPDAEALPIPLIPFDDSILQWIDYTD
jgi:hypothetical protein